MSRTPASASNPADLENIFQPFWRGRTAAERKTTGTGLGLTITRLLTQTMGGDISVSSTVGTGSTFRVKLLLSEVFNPRTISTHEDLVCGYGGARKTIMVVDDDENQRNLIHEILEPLGFAVIAARSGPECLSILESARPDLVLLDVAMPDMDGWTVGRKIRESRTDRLPIVMLSAFAPDPGLKSEADPVQDHYLIKPVDLRQLLGSIHTLLDIEWIYESPPTSSVAIKSARQRRRSFHRSKTLRCCCNMGGSDTCAASTTS